MFAITLALFNHGHHLSGKHKLMPGEVQCETDSQCAAMCKGEQGCNGGPQPADKKSA